MEKNPTCLVQVAAKNAKKIAATANPRNEDEDDEEETRCITVDKTGDPALQADFLPFENDTSDSCVRERLRRFGYESDSDSNRDRRKRRTDNAPRREERKRTNRRLSHRQVVNDHCTTASEIVGASMSPSPPLSAAKPVRPPQNAFSVLMSSRKTKSPASPELKPATQTSTFSGRDGLGAYIANPASYPSSRVITYSDSFVTIHDLYPKSSIHLLLLPRDPSKSLQDPFTALADPVFCAQVQAEVRKLRALAAKELKRRFGCDSAREQRHELALEKGEEEAHEGRDWSQDIMAGIHARPSMNHLHVHILSRDFHSDCMQHRKHYNSFHTGFFIDVDEFPLAEDDPRRNPGKAGFLREEFRCWRCDKGFGKSFEALKRHLEDEFEDWKKV